MPTVPTKKEVKARIEDALAVHKAEVIRLEAMLDILKNNPKVKEFLTLMNEGGL